MDYRTLEAHIERFECGRIMLTHMSQDMLLHRADVELECADDGMIVTL